MKLEKKEIILFEPRIERPGRQIRLESDITGNSNLTVTIGTAEDKNRPNTVYIKMSFWVDLKNRDDMNVDYDRQISKQYSRTIKSLYSNEIKDILLTNNIFPYFYENIYTYDFPENLNYNKKRSFTSIELHLHTCNDQSNESLALKNKSGTEIYDELIKVVRTMANTPLLRGELDFSVHKHKR